MMRSGFAAIVGAPNVGKSTLINALIRDEFLAVSRVAQTTLLATPLIHTEARGQIIWVDTPGLLPFRGPYYRAVLAEGLRAALDADVIVRLVDDKVDDPFFARVDDLFARRQKNVLRVRTKGDTLRGAAPENVDIVVSGKTGLHLSELMDEVFARLPEGPHLFPEDDLSPRHIRDFAVDWIREVLLEELRAEIPHATFVDIESFDEQTDGSIRIAAALGVERESQKRIVVGHKGAKIRSIGTKARERIGGRLGCTVHLVLHVKIRPRWRKKDPFVQQFGPTMTTSEIDRLCSLVGVEQT